MICCDGELEIRAAGCGDAPLLGAWWRDGDVMAHAGFPNGLDITDEQIFSQIENGDGLFILEAHGEPVGEMSCRDKGAKVAEIGIKICKNQRSISYRTASKSAFPPLVVGRTRTNLRVRAEPAS
ncbi:MAG: hypothetical protein FWE44_01525 [Defluviitaleaceae bacterium]|nr:hypothetical protein [Defluviitaleaceae bacterium]